MKMKNKILLIFLAFLFFFTIRSSAFTYDYSNALDTNNTTIYESYDFMTFSYLNNLGLDTYDFYLTYWKNGQWGSTYSSKFQVLYKNSSTNEYLVHKVYDFYSYKTTNKLYYIKDNIVSEISNSFYINGSNSSYGHCVYFLDFNNDNTINNICYLDLCGGNGDDTYSNNFERIIFNNDGSIWACGLSNFYIYNLSSQQITYQKYADSSVQYVCVNGLEELSNNNINDYIIIPSYYTICENNTPVTFSNSMLDNNFNEIHSAYCNSSTFGDSDTIPFYEDYSSSQILFNFEQGFIEEESEELNLYIQDVNLKKQFKFNFNLPKHKEDSVYYAFLTSYNRTSYSSVSAEFVVYELFTPLEYDGTFDKYLLYDQEGDYFIPVARN